MKLHLEMLLSPRTLRLRFCRRNGVRTFFRLRRRREFSDLRGLIVEARDLRLVSYLLFGPLRLLVGQLRRSLFPLLDCRYLLLDHRAHLDDRRLCLQGRKLLQIYAIKNAHIR